MKNIFLRFACDEKGATAIEYALLISLIAIAIVGAATTMGTKISSTFVTAAGSLK
jgi:pilus assembly protein Flp/PilA